MNTYLILQNPGHNRVYYNLAGQLALSELTLACNRLSAKCSDISIVHIAGVRYLSLKCEQELQPEDVAVLSRLSFMFAIYKLMGDGLDSSLRPVQTVPYEYLDGKIGTLQKYVGKTNELFTKMMINVALLSGDFSYQDKIQLLDPVAGRGTTLYEAAIYGFDAFGIEIEAKSVHENQIFFKQYLQKERYKYTLDKRMIFGRNKSEAVYIQAFEYAAGKEEFKDNEQRKKLGVVHGSAQDSAKYFKKSSFHLIVGDLPYGIAHGSSAADKSSTGTRNPAELISACLPEWKTVLKPSGTIVLAWNAFVTPKHRLAAIFEEHGFEVLSAAPYDGFEHMVDKAIKRDVIVAKKNRS